MENLLAAWREFLRGKRKRKDVSEFGVHFMDNILALHRELLEKNYKHGPYQAFKINDPKPRDIHKASVRDRLLHHAIYRILYPCFDLKFIYDSYSCRKDKGTHRAINRFREYGRIVSRNHTRTVWVLKCDIRKFFANIDHAILIRILQSYIPDQKIMWLLERVIKSFNSPPTDSATAENVSKGLPLGNLTSQLFVNIYMNEFDQFAKRELKVRYYIRYADDFVILHENRKYLECILPKISEFLETKLRLSLHPNKVFIKTFVSGVDFLGWVHFSRHRVLRTATKRRMIRRIKDNYSPETLQSYFGLLKHGNAFNLRQRIKRLDA